jgi:hypothetical protein
MAASSMARNAVCKAGGNVLMIVSRWATSANPALFPATKTGVAPEVVV